MNSGVIWRDDTCSRLLLNVDELSCQLGVSIGNIGREKFADMIIGDGRDTELVETLSNLLDLLESV